MESELDKLAEMAKSLMGELLKENDIEGLSRISDAAVRVKRLQDQVGKVRHEIESLEGTFRDFSARHRPREVTPAGVDLNDFDVPTIRGRRKKLRIEFNWERASKPGGREVIENNTSSSTIARFIERLSTVFGPIVLDKLARFRINRGPLVSKNPQLDFVNRSTGGTYGHQEISSTGYSVLTHSSTPEKIADVKSICKVLNLPVGLVTVAEAE